jgi:hypothetical protein
MAAASALPRRPKAHAPEEGDEDDEEEVQQTKGPKGNIKIIEFEDEDIPGPRGGAKDGLQQHIIYAPHGEPGPQHASVPRGHRGGISAWGGWKCPSWETPSSYKS